MAKKRYRDWLDTFAERAHVEYFGEHLSYNERMAIDNAIPIPCAENPFITAKSALDVLNYTIVDNNDEFNALTPREGLCVYIKSSNKRYLYKNSVWEFIDDIYYLNTEPMPENVGGYEPGTTFNNVGYNELVTGLLYPYQFPKFTSFHLSGGNTINDLGKLYGTYFIFYWQTDISDNIKENSISISYGNIELKNGLANIGSTGLQYQKIGWNERHTSNFYIKALNTKDKQLSKIFTMDWIGKSYYITSDDPNLIGDNFNVGELGSNQQEQIFNSYLTIDNKQIYEAPESQEPEYKYFIYPIELGKKEQSQIIDIDSNFNVAIDANWMGVQKTIINENNVAYNVYVYRTINKTAGNIKIKYN